MHLANHCFLLEVLNLNGAAVKKHKTMEAFGSIFL